MGGHCAEVNEKMKFSPNPNRTKSFIRIPCKHVIFSWIVEVVEWIDGASVFFCGVEDPPASPSLCVEARPLKSGFEGS